MKKRIIAFLLYAFACQMGLIAQDLEDLMKLVLEQNRELKAAREAYQGSVFDAGTGNTPPDPEVEFAYLFGKPSDLGKRIDFGVSQHLDFPTAYIHRSKVRDIKISRAELRYILTRQEVLLETKKFWIEQLYLNQMGALLTDRLNQAETIRAHVEKKMLVGEASVLEMGQSNLLLASLEGEFEELRTQQENNRMAISEICGGASVEIPEQAFPAPIPFIPDSLLEDYRQGPFAQYHLQGTQLKEYKKSLAVSEHLPKISAGYYSETITDQTFRGLRLGISVPLWEKANTVNRANSEIAQAHAEAGWSLYQQERELKQKLNRLESIWRRTRKLEEALGAVNSITLLSSALENGEISLSEYFYNSDLYFRNQQQLLRYKRDLLVQEAELMKIYL